ncbi:DNA gyrase subunit A [Clostridium sediminicola]|uniref:DNA gyrase subunit A n=1 Tax=Clostridium sediminicola TaxID=3114879 RepID=UPI0031F22200
MGNDGNILPIDISREMKKSYIDYAMSVIVGRALPDVRDGLKPVHRRILYSMYELGLSPEKGYRKCARIVGDVLGKYHPHGDTAVYDALVRLAQDFSTRYTLVNGHGNFGSVDGDSAAAMRYTEAKMDKIATQILRDINKNTVDFVPNFDGEEKEPSVLPARYPNLLVNGSSGIAVGMATNIPPHNLVEVINGINLLIENPDITILELMREIKGPDFPTAANIVGRSGIRKAFETGRGRIVVRATTNIEEVKGREKIVVTEIPYQVNKARLIENIAELVKDKKILGISDLRDESDRDGMRIVIELKKDTNSNIILNQLYKHTKLQDSFGVNMLALVNGEPKTLNLKQCLVYYLDFQKDIIKRRTKFDLDKALARAHILEGLRIALDNIDEVINLIRSSKNAVEAKEGLMNKFGLSDKQSQAILDMRLQRLTGLERQKIEDEYANLLEVISNLKAILESEELVLDIIKNELNEIKEKYGDVRRTQIIQGEDYEIDIEDLIDEKDVVLTLTHSGYIKRLPVDTYSAQRRGGRGIQAMSTKENDFVEHMFVTTTHNNVIFFTNRGKAYRLKAYQIPEAGRTAKGTNIINLIPVEGNERIQAVICLKEFNEDNFLVMGTKEGLIKKTSLDKYSSIRKNGLNAINLKEDDELISVRVTTGESEVLCVTKDGYAIRFHESDARPIGRTASGVKSITLRDEDEVVSMEISNGEEELLVVSEYGFGKRTPVNQYSLQKRGGKGVITYKISDKTGKLIGARIVEDSDEIMLINSNDIAIRINVADISTTSRNTMGVTLMRTSDEERIMTMTKVAITKCEEECEAISQDEIDECEVATEQITEKVNEEVNE